MGTALAEASAAPEAQASTATPASAPTTLAPAAFAQGPGAMLSLQRAAGNRAATAARRPLPRRAAVTRCGAGGCSCGGRCGEEDELLEEAGRLQLSRAVQARRQGDAPGSRNGSKITLATIPIGSRLQRKESADPQPVSSESSTPVVGASRVSDTAEFKPGVDVSRAEAKEIVDRYIAALSPLGATVKPFPSDLVASADVGPDGPMLQTWPAGAPRMLQRSPGGGYHFEGGFVGALQICYDLCSGELSVVGWVWAGGGVVTKGLFGGEGWWGAYVFAEKEFGRWKLDFMPKVPCGTCAPGCKPDEHDDGAHWGAGIAPFPVLIKPGEKASLKKAGIEVGVLLTPHPTRCDADVEVIALVDLTKYLGPLGAAVASAGELATEMGKKWNIEVSCGVGLAVSGNVHLCKSVPGGGIAGITSDSAKICGGGYVGCGIGLSKNKAALHMG